MSAKEQMEIYYDNFLYYYMISLINEAKIVELALFSSMMLDGFQYSTNASLMKRVLICG